MNLVRDQLKSFLENYYYLGKDIYNNGENFSSFLKFLTDRRNASLGDSLANFIYSISKSLALDECTGIKISDDILLKGFNSSELHSWIRLPGKKKDQANAIEALIFYMWLNFDYSIEEMSLTILAKINNTNLNLNHDIEEKRLASAGFSHLFNAFNSSLVNNHPRIENNNQ